MLRCGSAALLIASLLHCVTAYVEIVEERAGREKEFRLTCRHLDSRIAVLEAVFTPTPMTEAPDNATLDLEQLPLPYAAYQSDLDETPYPVRQAVNQRCSGVNHCSFKLEEDWAASRAWGPGQLYIKYACMADRRVTRYCNVDVLITVGGGERAQGFLATPGYPRYYLGPTTTACKWTVRAPHDQQVRITLLDVSLAEGMDGCRDELVVEDERGQVVWSSCSAPGGLERAPSLLSTSNVLQLRVLSRSDKGARVVPRRGVLVHYESEGCPAAPVPPADGYLVWANATHAHYMCCVGYVFPDTLQRHRLLACLANHWDNDLPQYCLNESEVEFNNNSVASEVRSGGKSDNGGDRSNRSSDAQGLDMNSDVVDVLVPSLLIAALLAGNGLVLYVIHRYRKRKNLDLQEEEELSNIVLT